MLQFYAMQHRDEDDLYEGVRPDDLYEDETDPEAGLRMKSLVLLLVFLLPTLLVVVELLTGKISGWFGHAVQPTPTILPTLVHF